MFAQTSSQQGPVGRIFEAVTVFQRAGALKPSYLLSLARASKRWGPTTAAGFAASAARRPQAAALVDDLGTLSFEELHRRTNAIANGLLQAGIRPGQGVGILCRNHRGFVEATIAVAKIGADALFMNTGFAAPQLKDVLAREEAVAVIYDDEFTGIVEPGLEGRHAFLAWNEGDATGKTLEDLVRQSPSTDPPFVSKPGRATILTSGTTGTPKGARRESKSSDLDTAVGVLGTIPYRVDEITMIAAPTFHAWGLAQLLIASMLSCTVVLRRRFDPEGTLQATASARATTVAVVPVMLQRILDLEPDAIRRHDTSSVRIVAASGSALPGELALRWMNTLGDNLYNFYGSTEAAQASIATPTDLRAAPGTAGRPPRGTVLKILDQDGREVPTGTTGRIFVGNKSQFEGYTGGGNKQFIDGLMSIGDVGHFDENGRLFVEGRDDDMIISGGENVFPIEIENLLADHEAIREVAVIGVPDQEFGQRLRAFVVVRPGQTLTADDVKSYVKQHLARYKVPRDVDFLDEIPRNPTGKVLKRVLREWGESKPA
jgi:fatty-acyl-CoA synthase